jgi:hypothetical protein
MEGFRCMMAIPYGEPMKQVERFFNVMKIFHALQKSMKFTGIRNKPSWK